MIRFLLTYSFIAFSGSLFSQNYAYSFNGSLTIDEQNELIKDLLEIPFISSAELRYKSDSKRGEIYFFVKEDEIRSESSSEFTPVEIKGIIIENNLEPLDFRRVK